MADESMQVSFALTEEDIWAFIFVAKKGKAYQELITSILIVILSILFALCASFSYILNQQLWDMASTDQILAILIGGLVCYFFLSWLCSFFEPPPIFSKDGPFRSHKIVLINENGISEESVNYKTWIDWRGVREVERRDGYIFIFIDTIAAVIIPERAFASSAAADNFYQKIFQFGRAADSR